MSNDAASAQRKEIAQIEGRYKRIGAVVGRLPEDVRKSYDLLRAVKAYRSPDAQLDDEVRTAVDRIEPGKDGKFDLTDVIVTTSERLARVGQFQATVSFVEAEAARRLDREMLGHSDEFLAGISKKYNELAEEYHKVFAVLPDFVFGGGYNRADKREDHINRGLVSAGPETLIAYRRAVELGNQMQRLVGDATAVVFGEQYPGFDHWLGLQVSNWDGQDAFSWMLSMRMIGYEAFDGSWTYPAADAPPIGLTGFLVSGVSGVPGAVLRMPETVEEVYAASERMHPTHGDGLRFQE